MNKKTVAIIGLRGIPGKYGGTETFIEELTSNLKDKFNFIVTCEGIGFKDDTYNSIKRVYFPAIKSQTSIPAVNDLIATIFLIYKFRKNIDIYYLLGPDSSVAAILPRILRKPVLTNPDGIEWKRPLKREYYEPLYMKPICYITFLVMFFLEYLSCKISNITIVDSLAIKNYLIKKYNNKNIVYIAYGARYLTNAFDKNTEKDINYLAHWNLKINEYYLTVARIVAENNIDMEIIGFIKSNSSKKIVIIGIPNKKDPYTKYLFKLKNNNDNILLLNGIYNKEELGAIRKNCYAYIHGYEVGGTNPSLLEQMLYGKAIFAYDVSFNREVLSEGGIYFKNENHLSSKIKMFEKGYLNSNFSSMQKAKLEKIYNWKHISDLYEKIFNLF